MLRVDGGLIRPAKRFEIKWGTDDCEVAWLRIGNPRVVSVQFANTQDAPAFKPLLSLR
jgi:hypothetical protein